MKHEIDTTKPENITERWPGELTLFHHMEFLAGVPQPLFLITTLKENGNTNACFASWSCFGGDSGGYYAVLNGLLQTSHTYKNILRDKEFCVNFISPAYYDACIATINENGDDVDELLAAGLTPEAAKHVKPPRIKEAFQSYECRLVMEKDLSGKGISTMVVGEVLLVSVMPERNDVRGRAGADGFMYYLDGGFDVRTGVPEMGAIAKLEIVRES